MTIKNMFSKNIIKTNNGDQVFSLDFIPFNIFNEIQPFPLHGYIIGVNGKAEKKLWNLCGTCGQKHHLLPLGCYNDEIFRNDLCDNSIKIVYKIFNEQKSLLNKVVHQLDYFNLYHVLKY